MDVDALVADHAARIRALVPVTDVRLTGSASVPGLDPCDVDLVVLADDVTAVAEQLGTSYPRLHPEQWHDDWAAFRDPGPPQVDVVVVRPGTSGDAHHRRAWDLIAADPVLAAEYAQLKAVRHGYEQRKAAFFDRVVGLLSEESAS